MVVINNPSSCACTGSGKTHTIEGGLKDQKGIIPRAAEIIFQCMCTSINMEFDSMCNQFGNKVK